jgi:membrane-bound lytic murein transglycosylase F
LPESIDSEDEKIKFTLAAYNCGLGHVLDARRLAEKYGKNPDVWTGNVEQFILNLSHEKYYHDPVVYYGYLRGEETYNFVNQIMNRYIDYKNLIKE